MATRTRQRPDTRPDAATLSAEPSVLAIVVTHRGRMWLKDCLIALANQTYGPLDVLVIDDASPDVRRAPHLKRLAKRHLRRRRWGFVRTSRPLGFGGAINWALSRVRTDAELLLFLHDDAALSPDAVSAMVERLRADPATAIVGPKIVAWDDPDVLEEVGMAADALGYPYKGLEEGEIDLGQHDTPSEVFYVTSTCMLMRHDVFRQVSGWDATMRAFTEDLDLCWRVRLTGHDVRVEPGATARHAIALATGQRRSPFTPTRYYIRRNRLRALIKNASSLRLLPLIAAFVVVSVAEMLAFLVLRQPGEVASLARALLWNVARFPQSVAERTRVQRHRRVPDRALRPLRVRLITRLHSYLEQQATRLEEAWGRRYEIISARGAQARVVGRRFKGLPGLLAVAALVALLLGFRYFLFAPPASLGELLPFPERATALWRAFVSPWQAIGLGQSAPAPSALVVLGIFPVLTLGASGAAQKLMVLSLGAIAFAGAYRLMADLVDRHGRVVAGFAYAFGAVGYAAMRNGRLGALFFGAAAPFVLQQLLRLNGWMRPPAWRRSRAVAALALGAALSAAFVPGSLFLYAFTAAVLAATRAVLHRGSLPLRGFTSSAFGLAAAWVLLLPWSASWWSDGGAFDLLMSGPSRRLFASSFAGDGMITTLLGQTPQGLPLLGLALPLLGVLAFLVAEDQRRRAAVALWGVVVAGGLVVAATAHGLIPPVVAGPIEAGVLPSAAFAGLAGLAVGAFRLDLPRRGLGLEHGLAVAALAAAGFLAAASIVPALLAGGWRTGSGLAEANARLVAQISSVLGGEAERVGPFRTLWVGERWTPPNPSVLRPVDDYYVSTARAASMADLFERVRDPADVELARVVASIEEGATDDGARLLAAFNVHFVVVEQDLEGDDRWLNQRGLALVREENGYRLFQNDAFLPRAAVYADLPVEVAMVSENDPTIGARRESSTASPLERRSMWRYESDTSDAEGTVFLAEQRHEDWTATLDDDPLERVDAGWGNGFALPGAASGRLVVEFPRTVGQILWLVLIALAWLLVIAGAFSRGTHRPRTSSSRVRTEVS